jgi:hypothetical protein
MQKLTATQSSHSSNHGHKIQLQVMKLQNWLHVKSKKLLP